MIRLAWVRNLVRFWVFCMVVSRVVGGEVGRGLSYNRDVRPVLQEYCFHCHGPDSGSRKAGLRLDDPEMSRVELRSGRRAVVAGDVGLSELVRRVESEDLDVRMPPRESGKVLGGAEREVLKRWIREGAVYETHWAFLPPRAERPGELPVGARPEAVVDGWIEKGWVDHGWKREWGVEATRAQLLRRVALDLTGLPPTREEIRHFEGDTDDHAYERRVDALLGSKRFGEHWAAWWLDLARYADSSGFQGDPYRSMWRWRDYVIEAFNDNMPFDQFTVEQMAGDLLPGATMKQKLATGFHRHHRFNTEFGSIDAEWRVEYGVDRVETMSAAWLGLTMGCARCHDHKFDPVSQREFFQMFALLTHVPERGVFWDGSDPVFEPSMRAPLDWQASEWRKLERRVEEARGQWERAREASRREEVAWRRRNGVRWEREVKEWAGVMPGGMGARTSEKQRQNWRLLSAPAGLAMQLGLDGNLDVRWGRRDEVVTNVVRWTNVTVSGVVEVMTNRSLSNVVVEWEKRVVVRGAGTGVGSNAVTRQARFGAGIYGEAWKAEEGGAVLSLENVLDRDRWTLAMWVKAEGSNGVLLSKWGQQALFSLGFHLALVEGRFRLGIHHKQFEFDSTMIPFEAESVERLGLGEWHHVALVMDGKRRNRGPGLYLDGHRLVMEPRQATVRGFNSVTNSAPLLVASRGDWMVDDLRWYDRTLEDEEVEWLFAMRDGVEGFRGRGEGWGRFFHRFLSSTGGWCRLEWKRAVESRDAWVQKMPQVMVMEELPGVPSARVLQRGQYDQPREWVVGGLPAFLGKWPEGQPTNRLGLARWLVSTNNPLTARVIMNRVWERLLGQGLVKNSENWGVQAPLPSHPELLDWLAVEWMSRGWDFKSMIKTVVMSRVYRQSSVGTLEGWARDPGNVWLGRGGRFRMSAEMIRDQALWASGLLEEKVGGPSVTSYLPGGGAPAGPERYRRSVYSLWQRTRFHPSLALFDAPTREACVVKRARTNTPLQVLALWNEVTYVEAARKLAERMMDGGEDVETRLRVGFERLLGREPRVEELGVMRGLWERQREIFVRDPGAAESLIQVGESWSDVKYSRSELAAYWVVANALLNLDETLTRE